MRIDRPALRLPSLLGIVRLEKSTTALLASCQKAYLGSEVSSSGIQPMPEKQDLTDKQVDERREAALKKLLATPHKPHKPKGDGRAEKAKRKDRAGRSPHA